MAALFAQPGQGQQQPAIHPPVHSSNGMVNGSGSHLQRTAASIHQAYTSASAASAVGQPGQKPGRVGQQQQQHVGGTSNSSNYQPQAMDGGNVASRSRPAYPTVSIPQHQQAQPQHGSPISSYHAATAPEPPSTLVPGPPPTEQMRLFNAYIYEYLYRQGFTEAARAFLVHAPETSVKRVASQEAGPSTSTSSRTKQRNTGKERASPGSTSPDLTSVSKSRSQAPNGVPESSSEQQLGNGEASVSHGSANTPPGSHMGRIAEDMDDDAGDEREGQDGFEDLGSANNAPSTRSRREKLGTAGSDASASSHSTASSSRFGYTGSKDSGTTAATSTSIAPRSSQTRKDSSGNDIDGGSNASDPPTSARTPPTSNTSGLFSSPTTSTPHAKSSTLPSQSNQNPSQSNSGSSSSPLPEPDVQITAPQGFLYEWWAVFWDVFRARGDKGGSPAAKAFLQAAVAPPTYDGQPLLNGQVFAVPSSAATGGLQQQEAVFAHPGGPTVKQQMQNPALAQQSAQQQQQAQGMRASLPPQSAVSQGSSAGRLPPQQQQGQGLPTGPANAPTPQGSQDGQQQHQQAQTRMQQPHQRQATMEIDSPAAQHRLLSQPPQGPGQKQLQSQPSMEALQYQGPLPGQAIQMMQGQPPTAQQNAQQHAQGIQIQAGPPAAVMAPSQQLRAQMPGGPAQRRYAVSGGPPGYPGPQSGQPGVVYRTPQGQMISAQPVGAHMRIVSGPGGPQMQTHPAGLVIQQQQQVQVPQAQHPGYPGQPPPIPAGPGQGLQHQQPQPGYMQQQQQPRPLLPQQQQAQQQHQQAMYAQQQQQQHRAGMMPQQQQQMMQQPGPPSHQQQQQQQLGLRARPPSVSGHQQQQHENASSPITMPMRAPSRSAAISPFPQHALPPGTPASNGPTPTPMGPPQHQQQFARPGQPPQQHQQQPQAFGAMDHESPMRRGGNTPPESVQLQQAHHARLMEQQRQHQAMSPHSQQHQLQQQQQGGPVSQQQMQMLRQHQAQQQQQQIQMQNGARPRQVFGGPQQQQGGPNGQSPAAGGGPEMAFSPQAGTPQQQQQAYHQMQQAQHTNGNLPLFRAPPNGNTAGPQGPGYPPNDYSQYSASLGGGEEGSSPNMVAPSPRPESVTQNAPPLAEIQEAISRHPSYANLNAANANANASSNGPAGTGKMQPPTSRTTRRTTVSNGQNGNSASTPGAGSQGAPTPTPNGLTATSAVNGAQGSPDAVHSQPPTPRTPNTQNATIAGQQESAGQVTTTAIPKPSPATKGKKRTAAEASGNSGSGPKEIKKARATRANAANHLPPVSADVAVPLAAEDSLPTSQQAPLSRQPTPQQRSHPNPMAASHSQPGQQQQVPNGYHYPVQAQSQPHQQQVAGNITVPTLPIQMSQQAQVQQQQQHQQQQSLDIVVGPAAGPDFGDLNAYGLSGIEQPGVTSINYGDPNIFSMLEDPAVNFEDYLNWGS